MKRCIYLICVFLALFLYGCGAASQNSKSSESSPKESASPDDNEPVQSTEEETPAEEAYSYLGAWIDGEEKTVIILEEGGIGTIITISGKQNSSDKKVMSSSLSWEEDEKKISISSNMGQLSLTKGKEGNAGILKVGEKTFHSFDIEEAERYRKEAEQQKQENDEKSRKNVEEAEEKDLIEVGSVIETGTVQLVIEETGIAEELYPEDLGGSYLYFEDVSGYQYLYLKGRIKNIGTEEYDSDYVKSAFVINDLYPYDAEMTIMANASAITDYLLRPLEESGFYIYSSVPDEAIETMEKCSADLFIGDQKTVPEHTDFRYTLLLK